MRQGFLPGQQRALRQAFRKADAFDRFRQRTRRAFFGMGLLALGTGASGFVAGRQTRHREQPADSAPTTLDAVALGPLPKLVADYPSVLAAIETGQATEALWLGFERLLLLSLSATEGVRATLARDLLLTARHAEPPAHLREYVRVLGERSRR